MASPAKMLHGPLAALHSAGQEPALAETVARSSSSARTLVAAGMADHSLRCYRAGARLRRRARVGTCGKCTPRSRARHESERRESAAETQRRTTTPRSATRDKALGWDLSLRAPRTARHAERQQRLDPASARNRSSDRLSWNVGRTPPLPRRGQHRARVEGAVFQAGAQSGIVVGVACDAPARRRERADRPRAAEFDAAIGRDIQAQAPCPPVALADVVADERAAVPGGACDTTATRRRRPPAVRRPGSSRHSRRPTSAAPAHRVRP